MPAHAARSPSYSASSNQSNEVIRRRNISIFGDHIGPRRGQRFLAHGLPLRSTGIEWGRTGYRSKLDYADSHVSLLPADCWI